MGNRFGRYELVAEIGRGGMAELFLGRLLGPAGFAKPVAIKRMLPHLSEDPRFVDMFLNEGRIAAKLSHPNICQVYELGEVDGELFLAMEYLEGVPWGELVTTVVGTGSVRDPIGILRLAASVIGQACDGLAYAHALHDARGNPTPVVHRDISPGNLYVTIDGACKVLDFGVSKIATEKHETRSGMIKGKLPYMPPEQLRGEPVDARVDVFAMGVVLWEALTGERLFVRENDYLIFKAILVEPIPSIAERFPAALGAQIDELLARALARDRDQRCPTIKTFGDELRAIVTSLGGLPPAAEIGAIVRDSFATRLADRSRLVAQVSAVYEPSADTITTETPVSVTRSVVLRDGDARPVRRHARRWPIVVGAGALVAIAVGVVAVASTRADDAVDASFQPQPSPRPPPVAIDAAPAVDEIAIDPVPAPPPPHEPSVPSAPRKPGFYSVDSHPYATIFVDGKQRDQTPLFRIELAAGRHQIKAVLQDGRTRSFAIRIDPGKDVSSGTLSW